MSFPAKAEKRRYTYGDYLNWPDEERWELIDGVAYDMSPAPTINHQLITGRLFTQISVYLNGKTCQVYFAPFDVRIPKGNEADNEINTVVQPDIAVVCDRSKLADNKGCKGAPDLVMEISSPSTAQKDLKIKSKLYERAGVREYWIVDSVNKTVTVFKREESGEFGKPEYYGEEDTVKVGIFEDLNIDLKPVFEGLYEV